MQLDQFHQDNPFTSEDLHLLTAVTLQVSLALDKARLHQQLLAQERIARELALAREIQLAFLPQTVPLLASGPLDLAAELHPAEEVSGDFYDYIRLDERRVALVVADVSGKGMPAALFMSMVRALLRQTAKPDCGPAQMLKQLNSDMARDNPKFMFVTIALGVYDASTGECVVSRAGHPAPLLRRAQGPFEEVDCSAGCLIGIVEDPPGITETRITLSPGDMLLFYTDGVTEAPEKGSGAMFGTARLISSAARVPRDAAVSEYLRTVRADVESHCAPHGPPDDVTLLVLRHR